MKNTKTKIILSVSIFVSVIGFVGIVIAASSSLYVSPASSTKTVGDTFNVSVGVNASGNKVCAAEGTLVFNNLSCQSITVASGVMSQLSPTCSNPNFLIGVPSCTTVDKTLFTISVKAENAGTASISITGVDVIGEGTSVGSASISGNYTINAVSIPPQTTPTLTPPQTIETPTPEKPTVPASLEEDEDEEYEVVVTTTEEEIIAEEESKQPEGKATFLAGIGNIAIFGVNNVWIFILIGIMILVGLIYLNKKFK